MSDNLENRAYTGADHAVYDLLRGEMEGTMHGGLFSPRDFEEDGMGLFRLDNAHLPAASFDAERFEWLKEKILFPFLIKPESFERVVDGIGEQFGPGGDVAEHLERGGSAIIASNHETYADMAVLMSAMTEAGVRAGAESPTANHHVIASRLVGLFKMFAIKFPDATPGFIVEDGLHQLGGFLQTVPASASGKRVRDVVPDGYDLNGPTRRAFTELLDMGGQTFLVAPSGTQDKYDRTTGQLVMDRVSTGTTDMLVSHDHIKAVLPLYMSCNPFTSDGGYNGAVDATFEFLEPRTIDNKDEVHGMMREIAATGNRLAGVHGNPVSRYGTALPRRVANVAMSAR